MPDENVRNAVIADYQSGMWMRHLKLKYESYGVGWNNLKIILDANMRRKRVFKFDKNFFSLNTEKSFYWAGFIMADGSISKRANSTQLSLVLNSKDENHLRQFASDIECEDDYIKVYGDTIGIRLTAKEFETDLIKFGIIPRKTYNFIGANKEVSKNKLIVHYLRGWIDGDGYIRTDKWCERMKLAGNTESLYWFSEQLIDLGFSKVPLIYPQKGKVWGELIISGKKNIKELYSLLECGQFTELSRKWDKIKSL